MTTRTRIFHFTPIRNLAAIVASGRILCKSQLDGAGTKYADIASQDIQRKRARLRVPRGPGGMLSEYVPFFFAPKAPMLFFINRNVDIYPEGQESLIYLVSSVQAVQEAGLPFVFTDGHPIMRLSNFYEDPADLDKINWTIMSSKMWNDTPENPDRQRKREAEFLVYQSCPWEIVEGLVVINSDMQKRVEDVLEMVAYRPPVVVRPQLYY